MNENMYSLSENSVNKNDLLHLFSKFVIYFSNKNQANGCDYLNEK